MPFSPDYQTELHLLRMEQLQLEEDLISSSSSNDDGYADSDAEEEEDQPYAEYFSFHERRRTVEPSKDSENDDEGEEGEDMGDSRDRPGATMGGAHPQDLHARSRNKSTRNVERKPYERNAVCGRLTRTPSPNTSLPPSPVPLHGGYEGKRRMQQRNKTGKEEEGEGKKGSRSSRPHPLHTTTATVAAAAAVPPPIHSPLVSSIELSFPEQDAQYVGVDPHSPPFPNSMSQRGPRRLPSRFTGSSDGGSRGRSRGNITSADAGIAASKVVDSTTGPRKSKHEKSAGTGTDRREKQEKKVSSLRGPPLPISTITSSTTRKTTASNILPSFSEADSHTTSSPLFPTTSTRNPASSSLTVKPGGTTEEWGGKKRNESGAHEEEVKEASPSSSPQEEKEEERRENEEVGAGPTSTPAAAAAAAAASLPPPPMTVEERLRSLQSLKKEYTARAQKAMNLYFRIAQERGASAGTVHVTKTGSGKKKPQEEEEVEEKRAVGAETGREEARSSYAFGYDQKERIQRLTTATAPSFIHRELLKPVGIREARRRAAQQERERLEEEALCTRAKPTPVPPSTFFNSYDLMVEEWKERKAAQQRHAEEKKKAQQQKQTFLRLSTEILKGVRHDFLEEGRLHGGGGRSRSRQQSRCGRHNDDQHDRRNSRNIRRNGIPHPHDPAGRLNMNSPGKGGEPLNDTWSEKHRNRRRIYLDPSSPYFHQEGGGSGEPTITTMTTTAPSPTMVDRSAPLSINMGSPNLSPVYPAAAAAASAAMMAGAGVAGPAAAAAGSPPFSPSPSTMSILQSQRLLEDLDIPLEVKVNLWPALKAHELVRVQRLLQRAKEKKMESDMCFRQEMPSISRDFTEGGGGIKRRSSSMEKRIGWGSSTDGEGGGKYYSGSGASSVGSGWLGAASSWGSRYGSFGIGSPVYGGGSPLPASPPPAAAQVSGAAAAPATGMSVISSAPSPSFVTMAPLSAGAAGSAGQESGGAVLYAPPPPPPTSTISSSSGSPTMFGVGHPTGIPSAAPPPPGARVPPPPPIGVGTAVGSLNPMTNPPLVMSGAAAGMGVGAVSAAVPPPPSSYYPSSQPILPAAPPSLSPSSLMIPGSATIPPSVPTYDLPTVRRTTSNIGSCRSPSLPPPPPPPPPPGSVFLHGGQPDPNFFLSERQWREDKRAYKQLEHEYEKQIKEEAFEKRHPQLTFQPDVAPGVPDFQKIWEEEQAAMREKKEKAKARITKVKPFDLTPSAKDSIITGKRYVPHVMRLSPPSQRRHHLPTHSSCTTSSLRESRSRSRGDEREQQQQPPTNGDDSSGKVSSQPKKVFFSPDTVEGSPISFPREKGGEEGEADSSSSSPSSSICPKNITSTATVTHGTSSSGERGHDAQDNDEGGMGVRGGVATPSFTSGKKSSSSPQASSREQLFSSSSPASASSSFSSSRVPRGTRAHALRTQRSYEHALETKSKQEALEAAQKKEERARKRALRQRLAPYRYDPKVEHEALIQAKVRVLRASAKNSENEAREKLKDMLRRVAQLPPLFAELSQEALLHAPVAETEKEVRELLKEAGVGKKAMEAIFRSETSPKVGEKDGESESKELLETSHDKSTMGEVEKKGEAAEENTEKKNEEDKEGKGSRRESSSTSSPTSSSSSSPRSNSNSSTNSHHKSDHNDGSVSSSSSSSSTSSSSSSSSSTSPSASGKGDTHKSSSNSSSDASAKRNESGVATASSSNSPPRPTRRNSYDSDSFESDE